MNSRLIPILFLFASAGLAAQSGPVMVTKNFHFREGIYLSYASFRNDSPDLGWDQVEAKWYTNPKTFLTQMEYIRPKTTGQTAVDPDSIWGFCMQGVPYMRLSRDWIKKELATFAPIQLRGKICYFDFDRMDTTDVLITAYNPANGMPFRKGVIKKEHEVKYAKILEFETGKVADFNRQNLLAWIGDDQQLVEAVLALREEELKAKLFKSLLIYVDRNHVYVTPYTK